MAYFTYTDGVKELVGKVFTKINRDDTNDHDKWMNEDGLSFWEGDKVTYLLAHRQDCCEYVWLEDVCGDLDDLINTPILVAEERTETGGSSSEYESMTYSFYEFRTIKGSVTLRFCGTSNGYYSETADLYKRVEQNVIY